MLLRFPKVINRSCFKYCAGQTLLVLELWLFQGLKFMICMFRRSNALAPGGGEQGTYLDSFIPVDSIKLVVQNH